MAVGPLETASSGLGTQTLVCSREFAFIYLCHSPQASGGTGTWMHLPCYLQQSLKPMQTPAEGLDAKGELVSLAHPSPLSGPI